jgi:phosphoribosylanthranilate isomerase
MTWVKICGMTNLEDALVAVDAGADAVGFVFYEKSPRNVTVEVARAIVRGLPEVVEKIGVSVKGNGVEPGEILLEVGFTGWQTYMAATGEARIGSGTGLGGNPPPKRARFLMALPMSLIGESEGGTESLTASCANWGKNVPVGFSVPEGLMETFVLDSGDLRQPGGTGKVFDWQKAVPIAEAMRRSGIKLVVAGGLTPENVGEAMRILKPWGVDVVSGVEAVPGRKDAEKVRAFVAAVRAADRKV